MLTLLCALNTRGADLACTLKLNRRIYPAHKHPRSGDTGTSSWISAVTGKTLADECPRARNNVTAEIFEKNLQISASGAFEDIWMKFKLLPKVS